jgi:ubiquitin-protein ligase
VLNVVFTSDYPFKAPTVSTPTVSSSSADSMQLKFKTKMYHPNVDSDGK